MAVRLSGLRLKVHQKLPPRLDIFCKSKNSLSNGTYYIMNIEDTIHFDALKTGDYLLYNEYVKFTNQAEHSEENFKKLVSEWNDDKFEPIFAIAMAHSTFFWVYDGNHRLTILKHNQMYGDTIPLGKLSVNFYECSINKIKEVLQKTVAKTHYNSWTNRGEYGYHSFNLYNISIQGQRNPTKRFDKIKRYYDFTNKTVLDLGCNTGGMIFHIPEIKKAIGIDFDEACIDACNYLKERLNFACQYEFYKKDLNECELNYKADIVFLLSIGSWVKNWEKLYRDAYAINKCVLLETNNDAEGIAQLELFFNLGASITMVSDKSDDDITGNHGRKTYLCNAAIAL